MSDKNTVNGGVIFRPYAQTNKQTTTTPEEHPQYVVYCLNRHRRMVTPPELVDAYIDLYRNQGEKAHGFNRGMNRLEKNIRT